MRSPTLLAVVAGLTLLRSLASSAEAPDQLQVLLARSPFGQSVTATGATPTDLQPEFRAVLEEQGNKIFSIYNPITRQSAWMDMNHTTDGISVTMYDEARDYVTVLYLGKSWELKLKNSPPKVRSVPSPSAPSKAAGLSNSNEYHDKPFRLGHVLEETMIRRAVRQSTPLTPPPVAR